MEELNAPGLTTNMQLYDTEILEIERVLDILNDKRRQRRDLDSFDKEIKGRFEEIGLIVSINWYECGVPDPDGNLVKQEDEYIPEIVIRDRVEKHLFDHDRQRHEIVNNVLEMPGQEKGQLLKASSAEIRKILGEQGHHH